MENLDTSGNTTSNASLQQKLFQLFNDEGEKVLISLRVLDTASKDTSGPSAGPGQTPTGLPQQAPKKKFLQLGHSTAEISSAGLKRGSVMNINVKNAADNQSQSTIVTSTATSAATQQSTATQQKSSKRKVRIICLTMKPSGKVRLHKLKFSGSSSANLSIGRTWSLDDIKSIDNSSDTDFQMNIGGKSYHWCVDGLPEVHLKVEFLYILLKLVSKLKRQPKMSANLTEDGLKDELEHCRQKMQDFQSPGGGAYGSDYDVDDDVNGGGGANGDRGLGETGGRGSLEDAYLKVQFDQEDLKLDEVLMGYQWKAGGDADAIESRLVHELTALEAANLHAIIQADDQSAQIVKMIDKSLAELDKIDQWLSLYHTELLQTGKDIQHIENQNKGLQVQTVNQKVLKNEMDHLMALLAVNDDVIDILRSESMESFEGLLAVEKAAGQLQKCLQIKLEEPLNDLSAIKERIAWFGQQCSQFSQRLQQHFQSLVNNECDISRESKRQFSGADVSIVYCESLPGLLYPTRNLIGWQKDVDARRLLELQMIYCQNVNSLYRQSLSTVFELLKARSPKKGPTSEELSAYLFAHSGKGFFGGGSLLTPIGAKSTSMASLMGKTHKRGVSSDGTSHLTLPSAGSGVASPLKMSKGMESSASLTDANSAETRIDVVEAFENYFKALYPIMITEYNFLVDYFHFSGCSPAGLSTDELLDRLMDVKPVQKDMKTVKKLDELMETVFDGIIPETLAWLEVALKPDVSCIVGLLAVLERYKNKAVPVPGNVEIIISQSIPFAGAYISALQERLNTIFERFVEDQVKAIDETKLTLKTRSGILSFIRVFPKFVKRMESFCRDLPETFELRKSVNNCYNRAIKLIFDNLEQIAKDLDMASVAADDREQMNAHILTIENMHHLHSELRALKISALETHVKHSKGQYELHLSAYIRAVVRKPIAKLLTFFEGMEELLKTKQPEEIPFHLNFNKASLKKCISFFPGKEVKKSLETLYKRVDKHFCEEEGLLRVVWHGIQEEFIRLHQHFESLIQQCYPESDIHLLFSVQDLCTFFSDIAKNN